jgi:enamine deaminase RidA (YjgF/YER057c/UK114 family)
MSGILLPDGWPRPSGYSQGVRAKGTLVAVAGQVGWEPLTGRFATADFVGQVTQALKNVKEVLASAGSRPEHLVRLTWYITDRAAYTSRLSEIGAVYRAVMGAHYPAMTLVVVAGLLEEGAMVEIEATAVLPE